MPPTASTVGRSPHPMRCPASDRSCVVLGETGAVHAVRDHLGRDAVIALHDIRPVAADADAMVHVLDRRPLALGQHGAGEVVDVMDRAHDGRHAALRAQREQGPRRQAVLGVVDVRRTGVAHAGREGGRVAQDARFDILAGTPIHRHQPRLRPGLAEEGGPVGRQGPQLHVVPPIGERLGETQGVHHPTAGLRGVGGQADPHPRAGLILRWRRRAVRPRRSWAPAGRRRPPAPIAGR